MRHSEIFGILLLLIRVSVVPGNNTTIPVTKKSVENTSMSGSVLIGVGAEVQNMQYIMMKAVSIKTWRNSLARYVTPLAMCYPELKTNIETPPL